MSELPRGLGRFTRGQFTFEVDDGLSLVTIEGGSEVDEQSFAERFAGRDRIASWLLARLKHLADGSLALEEETIEIVEGGVFVIDFVVRRGGVPIGKVQLQAGEAGAALLGVVSTRVDAVIDAFILALEAEPEALAECSVRVRDPSWPEGRIVHFGFDGTSLRG